MDDVRAASSEVALMIAFYYFKLSNYKTCQAEKFMLRCHFLTNPDLFRISRSMPAEL